MNRFLQWFNLFGVVALAALCVAQWRANRQMNLEVNRLQRSRLEQAARLTEQEKSSAGQAADLAGLQSHLASLTGELKQTADQLAAAERELRQALAERDQLKSSVTNWAAAVAVRDERLKQAASQLQTLAGERNTAVKQFNDLAERHNQLVKDWNELQSRLAE
mgnify:CR=1 FL=1